MECVITDNKYKRKNKSSESQALGQLYNLIVPAPKQGNKSINTEGNIKPIASLKGRKVGRQAGTSLICLRIGNQCKQVIDGQAEPQTFKAPEEEGGAKSSACRLMGNNSAAWR